MALNREKIVASAQKFIQRGQLDKAIKEFQRIVEEDPKDVRTLLKIGDLFSKKGERDNAIQTYLKVAEFYSDQGFYLKAVAVYKQILKVDPQLIDVNVKLADLYGQLGLGSDALAQYQNVALFFEKAGETKKTLQILKKMIDLDPANVATRVKIAELYAKESMNNEALQEFQQAASVLKQQNRLDDYAKVLERILHIDANNMAMARDLAEIHLQRGDPKRALAKLQVCFKTDPKDVPTLELLTQAFNALGQTAKTVSVYRELAKIFMERGEFDRRRQTMRKILEIAPDDEEARAEIEMRQAAGAPAASPPRPGAPQAPPPRPTGPHAPIQPSANAPPLPSTKVGVSRSPPPIQHAPAHSPPQVTPAAQPSLKPAELIQKLLTETDVYIKYGLKDKALEHLKKIFSLGPDNLEAHAKVRDIYLQSGDMDGAAATLLTMVNIAERRGEQAKARQWLEDILKIQPNNAEARGRLRGQGGESADDGVELVVDSDDDQIIGADDDEGDIFGEEDVVPDNSARNMVDVAFDDDLFEAPATKPQAPKATPAPQKAKPESPKAAAKEKNLVDDEDDAWLTGVVSGASAAKSTHDEEVAFAGDDDEDDGLVLDVSPKAEPARAAPSARAAAPVKAEEPADEVDVSDELEEAEFFEQQGLESEAADVYRNILAKVPGHPVASARLRALSGEEDAPSSSPTPAAAESKPVKVGGVTKQLISDDALGGTGFDLASELAGDLGGDDGGDEEIQFSVEDVFAEFKKGVAATVSEKDFATHYDLGIAYKEMDLVDDAVREFMIAAKAPEKEVDAWSMIGICRMEAGDASGAIEAFKKASNSDRITAKQALAVQYEMANAQEVSGEVDTARALFAKVAKLDPSFRDAAKRAQGAPPEQSLSEDDDFDLGLGETGATTSHDTPPANSKKGKISYL